MITNNQLTIAILGGAGKAGRPLVQQALAAGHTVRLLLRHPQAFNLAHERLEIVHGDVRDRACVHQLLASTDALLSTLGHTKGEPKPMMAAATQTFVTSMEELGIRRCVVVTSLFVTGREALDQKTQEAADYMQQHFPLFMDNRRLEFEVLSGSLLDWTYVRVPLITQDPATGGVAVSLNHLPGQQISAVDLADFLLSQLIDQQYIGQAPFVASKQ